MAHLDLPAFGIRDLNGPKSPPGIVQITASQYDSTIHSEPDAVLSYIDLDDGELITVGSSFELQQRLEEPIPPSVSPTPSLILGKAPAKAAREAKENTLVHIFDIQHTTGSVAVWREHEAHTSRKLRPRASSSSSHSSTRVSLLHRASSPESNSMFPLHYENMFDPERVNKSSPGPPQSAQPTDTATVNEGASHRHSAAHPVISGEGDTPMQKDKAPVSAFTRLESHLGPLADFLESTADGLRKLAETTAEADTTPVENVLSGFKKILKEAGEFGLDLLATLVDEELQKNRSNGVDVPIGANTDSNPQQPSCLFSATEETGEEDKREPRAETPERKVSFVEPTPSEPLQMVKEHVVPNGLSIQRSSSEVQTSSLPLSERSTNIQQPPQLSLPSKPKFLFPPLSARYRTADPAPPTDNSILDSPPSESDFLTRYPPLSSLRKSVSVSGLQSTPASSSHYQPSSSLKSVFARYPSIEQLEEKSPANLQPAPSSKQRFSHLVSPTWPPVQPARKKTDVYKKPTVEDEDEHVRSLLADLGERKKAPGVQGAPKWPTVPLPGAWPEPKLEQQPEPKREEQKNKESATTADDSTVSKDLPWWLQQESRGPFSGGLSQRAGSPDDMIYSRGSIFPRKSQTVSGTNPAARLNGPFDPLAHIPVLQPRPQRSQPDLSASKVGFLNTRVNPAMPGFAPQRSQTLHHTDRYKPRDAAPYQNPRLSSWENYLKNNRSTTATSSLPYYPLLNPFSDWPTSRFQPTSTFSRPVPPATRPPVVSAPRPPRPFNGTLPSSGPHMYSLTSGSPPSQAQLPQASRPEIIRGGPPKADGFSIPSPPTLPAPPPAAVLFPPTSNSSSIPRSSSILSPCPPPFTRPRGRSGVSPPAPFSSKSVDDCVKVLKAMGFGEDDPNELARLNIYAGAAAGDVLLAIELIEEDREAAKELGKGEHIEISKTTRKEVDVEENPWED
ncbi:hypothetical protein Z517_12023 [Fonsecaea pedrosoi CBS 271.37]|uniref:Uncharacterized protein n=1 Tax=Fonsecaea pedrosoi CBS 271.37 TaxID=1442368 RepID=A0A0D2GS17_9EURO|nr:uncharacterized protein Z517_12023 [Fonsecaea pedrosoi CBS 271.37]KIW75249.1 hypothetical protein Z517_12023 [Fonsecaea pedrosoi CBS 271.37]